jgi:tryptophanyl-tRNA synthetase
MNKELEALEYIEKHFLHGTGGEYREELKSKYLEPIKQTLQDYEQRIKELTNELHVLRDVVEKHCNTYVLKDVSKGCWTND